MEESFRRFYRTLDGGRFKLFRRNDVYLVFDADIDRMPEYDPKDVTERKGFRELRLSQTRMEEVVRLMLTERMVGVQEYEDTVLVREGFPGNWKDFTDLLLDRRATPSIMAVKFGTALEVSFLVTSETVIYSCSFEDDDVFSNLYGVVNEINVVEAVHDDARLAGFFNGIGVSNHMMRSGGGSVGLLCGYLRVGEEQYRHEEYARPYVCRVDKNVLSALNLCSEEEHSVIKTFACSTNQGWRLLHKFFMQPLRSREEIDRRLDIVDALKPLDLCMLREFPDLLRLTRRITSGRISLQEMLRLLQVIRKVPQLVSILSAQPLLDGDFVKPLRNLDSTFQPLIREVESVVDLEAAERNIYRIRLSVSEGLCECDRKLGRIDEDIQKEYERVSQICARIRLDKNTRAFKVTRAEYQKYQDVFRKNGFLELSMSRSGVSLSTRNLSFLNAERMSVETEVEREERHAMERMRATMRGYVPALEALNYIVALADVFSAFSMKAMLSGYSRPVFGERMLEIRRGFHPVLEDTDYITNSIEMDEKRVCVITGPNMGGKSTFLKTCGVMAVLAQVGSYVPAEYCSIPIFDGVYVRIGASDCAFTGTSTFMMEMTDIARICRLSTPQSLVIIDELGRGTSAIDGLSIARAVKEHLISKDVLCLCATHFPELCGDDVLNKRVKNEGTLLMYEVVDGVCDTSFGITVAEKTNFPEEVVAAAKEYMLQY